MAICGFCFQSPSLVDPPVLTPCVLPSLNVLTIGLPGYRMYIKVDRRPLSPGVLHNCLAPDKPLVILLDRMDIGRPYERIKFVYQNADLSLGLRKKSRYARRIRLRASESKRRQIRPS